MGGPAAADGIHDNVHTREEGEALLRETKAAAEEAAEIFERLHHPRLGLALKEVGGGYMDR